MTLLFGILVQWMSIAISYNLHIFSRITADHAPICVANIQSHTTADIQYYIDTVHTVTINDFNIALC